MKFAKELERDLVPEWRIKYLNYKLGKKHVKAITRAINRANGTPSLALARRTTGLSTPDTPDEFVTPASRPRENPTPGEGPRSVPIRRRDERQSLTEGAESDVHYGSIVPTPPDRTPAPISESSRSGHPFELPAPAIKVPSHSGADGPAGPQRPSNIRAWSNNFLGRAALDRQASSGGFQRGATNDQGGPSHPGIRSGSTMANSTPSGLQTPRARMRRMFSLNTPGLERYRSKGEYDMKALDEVRDKEREFFKFLDSELKKVDTFYREKEDHAGERLTLLRGQLHEMRNRRTSEMAEVRRRKQNGESSNGHHHNLKEGDESNGGSHIPLLDSLKALDPLKAKLFKSGPNSKALSQMVSPSQLGDGAEERRDYVRRPTDEVVPYRTAKRKLKLALQEYYRGLELLKSYALLNRTAFRKLNKKYDKAVHARPPYRYMNEKVNKAWFVNSDVLEGLSSATEDLYARYFERGNHKIAAGKLKSLSKKKQDESGSAFQNGLLIGIGMVFGIQGLTYGAQLLWDEDDTVQVQTSYLLQIYGGYFLMWYLFSLFCLDCRLWMANRVNYQFIFEFDPRSQLDWRQLSAFPSVFLLLLGMFMWLNFTRYGSPDMYLYYPVILIFVTFVVLFMPAPIFYHKSRKWFLYSHWRLFFAGLYPVEFRDFFLGDMYCSLTYAMCNIELFFCLYAHGWNSPTQCNSNHSQLLGFFACLPPIWRFLQCIRRYKDTRNIFPHLVNCGKYTASILSGVFLSVYRIQNTHTSLALFVAFSIINGFYTAFWDVFMDFSLLQPHARYRFLRDITALKSRWPYYLIMVVDPILRFNWVFYPIFTHDTQHSSIASFLIGFAEVTRRGMWTLLRVENEHCANVAQYKASRDIPLPYNLQYDDESESAPFKAAGGGRSSSTATSANDDDGDDPDMKKRNTKTNKSSSKNKQPAAAAAQLGQRPSTTTGDPLIRSPSAAKVSWTGALSSHTQSGHSTGVDVHPRQQTPPTTGITPSSTAPVMAGADTSTNITAAEEGRTPAEESLRRRQRAGTIGTMKSITRLLAEAHKQDFEKKRKPSVSGGGSVRGGAATAELDAGIRGVDIDVDDDDDEDEDDELIGSDDNTDDETGSMADERMEVREAEMLARKGKNSESD